MWIWLTMSDLIHRLLLLSRQIPVLINSVFFQKISTMVMVIYKLILA